MKKTKVGIMTFHYAHNYGAMLQAFALRSFLNENGFEAEIINYVPTYMELKYLKVNFFKVLMTFKRSVVMGYIKRLRNKNKFEIFEKHYLGIEDRKAIRKGDLSSLYSNYDVLLFGSDQIWNTNITHDDLTYFGEYADSMKKISYAASSGNAINMPEYREIAKRFLSDFSSISVRENNSKEVLAKILNKEVVTVLDPVFLLDIDAWLKQAEKSSINIEDDYVIYYSIQQNEELSNECIKYARENNLRIVEINGEMKKTNKEATLLDNIGPNEFLYLLNRANTVFTNSFHAVAFSIIFNKHVFIRAHTETGNRVTDLVNLCGCDWDGESLFEMRADIYLKLRDRIALSKKYLFNSLNMDFSF